MKKYDIDYGFACGRHWVEINGKQISQTGGADLYLPDEQIEKIFHLLEEIDKKEESDEKLF